MRIAEVLDVLAKLTQRMGNLQPALQALGDDMVERAKQTCTGFGFDGL